MNNCVLAVDIGTSALKAAVVRADGKVLDFCREEFAPIKIPCEQKFSQKWIFAFGAACKKMQGAISDARAICVSGNGPTLVFEDGTTLLWNAPILENEELKNAESELENATPDSSGIFCEAKKSIFIPRILAAKNIFPAQWNEGKKIFSCPEFLINKICKAQITILPEARFKAAYWSEEILDALGIPRGMLCDFFPSMKIAGYATEKAACEFGVPYGIPIIGAGPDFVAALIGTATIKAVALCDRAGSSEGLNLCTSFPITADEIRTLPSPVAPFWNASFLIENPGKSNSEKVKNFVKGIRALKKCAEEHGVFFDDTIAITGGQSRDENLIQEKADAAEIKIALGQIADAELLGDAAIAFTALGEFDSLQNATDAICKKQKIFYPKNSKGEK
ncbi:MAG: hypothetical protein K2F89_02300 [Treponemataceae bacterium]|nr:hypothetical protein [Treponemataceae bacterium]